MNEEQREKRDARVRQLADAAAEAGIGGRGVLSPEGLAELSIHIQMRINLALDEQAKEIAAALTEQQAILESLPTGPGVNERAQMRVATEASAFAHAADIAAGFGDDR